MQALVIYHANCLDGFGAAYAAWRHYGDNAEYVPAHYGDCIVAPGKIVIRGIDYPVTGRTVVIVDFSLGNMDTNLLMLEAGFVIWLDHHKTAILEWLGPTWLDEGNTYFYTTSHGGVPCEIVLDNEHSGAYITWAFYHEGLIVPALISHIEDRDLWKFKLRYTKEVIEGIKQLPQKFAVWDEYFRYDTNLDKLIATGSILMKNTAAKVAAVANGNVRHIQLKNAKDEIGVFVSVNVVNDISETGNALCLAHNLPSCTFFIKDGEVICSLRSVGDFDVSVFAKNYGGGGHKNAAGFKMPVIQFFNTIWLEYL